MLVKIFEAVDSSPESNGEMPKVFSAVITGSHEVHVFIHLFFIHILSRRQPAAVALGSKEGENGRDYK